MDAVVMVAPQDVGSMSLGQIADTVALPMLRHYVHRLADEKLAFELGGVRGFDGSVFIFNGAAVRAAAMALRRTPPDAPERAGLERDVRELIAFTSGHLEHEMTWGLLMYVEGLDDLRRQRVLDRLVAPDVLARLRVALDWRAFTDEKTLTVGHLPTNYLGVAQRIAMLRRSMGWDTGDWPERLAAKIATHARDTGNESFVDETHGDGRFDTYSMVLPTTRPADAPDSAVDVLLQLANPRGDGFSYGRSIGLYGDAEALRLADAADAGLLRPNELKLAYAYDLAVARKLMRFWYDPQTQAFNLWDGGRRTDGYRNKPRILPIAFEVFGQLITTRETWERLGFSQPVDDREFAAMLARLPRYRYFPFSRGAFDRGLLVVRDGGHVFSLPIVNGSDWGTTTYTAYLPIPQEDRVIEAPPYSFHPLLVPSLTLADGRVVAPIAYTTNLTTRQEGERLTLRYEVPQLALAGERSMSPAADVPVSAVTEYRFSPGTIERRDTFTPAPGKRVTADVGFEFLSAEADVKVDGARTTFAGGHVAEIRVDGLPAGTVEDVSAREDCKTSHGASQRRVSWRQRVAIDRPVTITWTIQLRPYE